MFSFWEQRSFHGQADLLIVGAGLTGLFAAMHYQRRFPGHRVRVLERGPHPSGASVKNAGFACFGSPSEILADMAAEGTSTAVKRVEERWLGLQELRSELGDDRIGFVPSGGNELFAHDSALYTQVANGFDGLNAELRDVFGRSVYSWRDDAIPTFGLRTGHMAHTPLEGAINSGAMMRALLAKVQSLGVDVRFNQPVLGIEPGEASARVLLPGPAEERASQVIVATNGYARGLFPHIDILPGRGQVVLTEPIPGLKLKGTFHAEEGYFYFRDLMTPEGPCVLLGGGRHLDKPGETTTDDGTTPHIQHALEELMREVILPGQPVRIAQRWSGVMGFRSAGKSPLVERVAPRVIVAAGLSGMGVAIGIRVARRAVGLVSEN